MCCSLCLICVCIFVPVVLLKSAARGCCAILWRKKGGTMAYAMVYLWRKKGSTRGGFVADSWRTRPFYAIRVPVWLKKGSIGCLSGGGFVA